MPRIATKEVELRFYGTLNDFLHPRQRQVTFRHGFFGSPTIKDIIESLGVPHVEVALVLHNGNISNLDNHAENGDRITCYSNFHSIKLGTLNLIPDSPNEIKFVLDVHLGKLAKFLRIMGFDTLYRTDYTDDEIINISNNEQRTILTRDLGILRNGATVKGYFIRSTNPKTQLKEVMNNFSLHSKSVPYSRCSICNGMVEVVPKEDIIDKLNFNTIEYYSDFFRCQSCGQIYWEGSHFKNIEKFIDENINGQLEG